jgi:hypothetical protein
MVHLLSFGFHNQPIRRYQRQCSDDGNHDQRALVMTLLVGANNCKDDFAMWWMGLMEGKTPGSRIQEG